MKVEEPNFIGKDGKIYLVRCPKCNLENYAYMVATGQCCWCGYEANTGTRPDVPPGKGGSDTDTNGK